MKAFTKPNGAPKSHRRPRKCEHCRQNPKGGCILPFRHLTQVRRWVKYGAKPFIPKYKLRIEP